MSLSLLTLFIVIWVLLVTVLGFITLGRYISYKERVAMAQLGFSIDSLQPDTSKRHGQRGVLWGGVITAMSGLGLLFGLSTLGMGVWLLGGLLPLFVGIGMVLIYFVLGASPEQPKSAADPSSEPVTEQELPAVVVETSTRGEDHPS
ncbi:MAG: hypothetical protein ACYCZF_15925 [Anaerolineae bacterium]